ncbi:MAG: efflux transporter outer membrane subunit [Pelomonas sp.]|nr:efflux transporter outer membrane subunit [Roseateles sp.]
MNSKSATTLRSALVPLAAALALGGCINLAPEHQRPAAPVAASWPAPAAADAKALDWEQFYAADPRLVALIRSALANNRDLRVATLNAEQARQLARVSDANRWPTIGIGGSAARAPNAFGVNTTTYEAGVALASYQLDLFGQLRNQSDAATARYFASAAGVRAARINLIAAVASAHYSYQADTEMLELAQRTLATRQDSERLTRLMFDNGAASALDRAAAESATAAAASALAQATRQQAQDRNALVLLTGEPALAADLPAGQPLAATALPEAPAGLPSEVLIRRPDVIQAESQLSAAEADVGAARANFFPSITLTSELGTASTALRQLFKNTVWTWSAQALLPIFDAGRNRANLEAAKAAQGAAVAQYEKAVQTAFREVSDALVARQTWGEQLQSQQRQTDAERERLQLTELRAHNGAASALELLDAQRSSFAAEQALVQARLAGLVSGVQLYQALGGGDIEAR